MRVGLLVPTLNAGPRWSAWLAALAQQTRQPDRVLVIDSDSSDDTAALARAAGHEVVTIRQRDFDHGATRQLGLDLLADCQAVVCMTQDAVLASDDALAQLLQALQQPQVGVAWGRQLPHDDATPLAIYARNHNYPPASRTVALADSAQLGLKTAFCSNSFALWRREALAQVGGFPRGVLMAEDMLACARLLEADWQVAYVAEAAVFHSHNYRALEEFRRYVDIGATHASAPWLLRRFGGAGGEGLRYVRGEQDFMRQHGWRWRTAALAQSAAKWLGYRVGRLAPHLPDVFLQRISMHPQAWRSQPQAARPLAEGLTEGEAGQQSTL